MRSYFICTAGSVLALSAAPATGVLILWCCLLRESAPTQDVNQFVRMPPGILRSERMGLLSCMLKPVYIKGAIR